MMSVNAPTTAESSMTLLSYFDVAVLVVAAPIALLIGVPATGYLAGSASWIVLRAIGVAVERYAAASAVQARELSLRLGYLMGRLFVLAMTVILVRKGSGQDDGLTALAVIVVAFTLQLFVSFANRPRRS
jgi:hypothetical protein